VDFAYGPVIQHLGTDGFYNDPNTGVFRLIDHVNG
jgi:hypothetical protein